MSPNLGSPLLLFQTDAYANIGAWSQNGHNNVAILTKNYQRWLLNASLDGMTLVFREFWPDINHAIFNGR